MQCLYILFLVLSGGVTESDSAYCLLFAPCASIALPLGLQSWIHNTFSYNTKVIFFIYLNTLVPGIPDRLLSGKMEKYEIRCLHFWRTCHVPSPRACDCPWSQCSLLGVSDCPWSPGFSAPARAPWSWHLTLWRTSATGPGSWRPTAGLRSRAATQWPLKLAGSDSTRDREVMHRPALCPCTRTCN